MGTPKYIRTPLSFGHYTDFPKHNHEMLVLFFCWLENLKKHSLCDVVEYSSQSFKDMNPRTIKQLWQKVKSKALIEGYRFEVSMIFCWEINRYIVMSRGYNHWEWMLFRLLNKNTAKQDCCRLWWEIKVVWLVYDVKLWRGMPKRP